MNMNDLVGTWEVPLYDKIHKIQFEHGTTTGRRVLWIDNDVNEFCYCFFFFSTYCRFELTFCFSFQNFLDYFEKRMDVQIGR